MENILVGDLSGGSMQVGDKLRGNTILLLASASVTSVTCLQSSCHGESVDENV